MRVTILLTAALLAGCAQDTAVLRIMDYGGALPSITGRGCAVHQSGAQHAFAGVRMEYSSDRCQVQIVAGEG